MDNQNGQNPPPANPVAVNAQPAVQLNQDFINERALHLLLRIPVYIGHPDTRFDEWVRHLDNILTPTNWAEAEKIRALAERLAGSAYDTYSSLAEPNDTYEGLKEKIKNRYHGAETHAFYQREFEDRCRKPGETIPDYAYSLKKLAHSSLSTLAKCRRTLSVSKTSFLERP